MTASSGVVLSNLAYLIGAVVLAIIGGLVVWLVHRQPKSVDANVESFHRGLRALAPDPPGSGPSRGPASAATAGSRVRPRPAVSVLESADQQEEDQGSPPAGQEAGTVPGRQTQAEQASSTGPRGTPTPAAAGDGAGDRAEAETG